MHEEGKTDIWSTTPSVCLYMIYLENITSWCSWTHKFPLVKISILSLRDGYGKISCERRVFWSVDDRSYFQLYLERIMGKNNFSDIT